MEEEARVEMSLENRFKEALRKAKEVREYIKEDLETMLRNHLKNEAKLTEIQLKQEEYEERLQYAGTVYQDNKEDVIEGMQLSGQAISDIPRSNTNKVSDTTYNTVVGYNREINHINKEDRAYLERKILECEEEKKKLDKQIVRVNNMLQQLSNEEEFIIKSYYMRKSKWDYVANEYYEEFQKPKSINQLLNIRDNAITSMLEILNTVV